MVILTFASSKGVILPLKKANLLVVLEVNVNSVMELDCGNYNFDLKITQYIKSFRRSQIHSSMALSLKADIIRLESHGEEKN